MPDAKIKELEIEKTDYDGIVEASGRPMLLDSSVQAQKSSKRKKAWHEPDSRYAWVQVLAAGLIFLIIPGVNRSFSLIYERLLQKYGRSDSVTAWVPSVYGTVRMCSSPLIGFLVHRYTERAVCFFGAIVSAASLILTALSPSLEYVFLSYGFLYGVATNACIVPAITTVSKYFDKKRGLAMGIAYTFMPIGSLVMSPLIQFLFKEYDYFGAMLILSAILLEIATSALLMRPLPRQKYARKGTGDNEDEDMDDMVVVINKENGDDDNQAVTSRKRSETGPIINDVEDGSMIDIRSDDDSTKATSRKLMKSSPDARVETTEYLANGQTKTEMTKSRIGCMKTLKWILDQLGADLMKNRAFMIFSSFSVCFLMALDLSLSFQTAFLREKGFSDAEVLISLILFGACDIPCRLISGYIFDHRRLRKHKVTLSAALLFGMGLFLLLFPFSLELNFPVSMVCLAINSSCRAMFHSQHATVIAEIVGREKLEAGVSLNRFFQGVGLLISSPLGGLLKDCTGTYATGYYAMSVLLLLNTGTFLAFKIVSFCVR